MLFACGAVGNNSIILVFLSVLLFFLKILFFKKGWEIFTLPPSPLPPTSSTPLHFSFPIPNPATIICSLHSGMFYLGNVRVSKTCSQKVLLLVALTHCSWWPTLCSPLDCSPPGSSVHGILHARILEWVAVPFSRWFSRPRDRTWASHTAGRFFTIWATRKAPSSWWRKRCWQMKT